MPLKLLIVDDQPGITTVIQRTAAALGFETRTVRDPLKATDAFLDFMPDAVVLDIVMPEKDGLDLLEEMILSGHPARYVVVSGYGETYLRLAEGVARFHGVRTPALLRKPFRRDELVELLRDISFSDAGRAD